MKTPNIKIKINERLVLTNDYASLNWKFLYAQVHKLDWNSHMSKVDFHELVCNSLSLALLLDGSQIGYARFLTDYHVFSSLCDLYIAPERRNNGYGRVLLQNSLALPEIRSTLCLLRGDTTVARRIYTLAGFRPTQDNDFIMLLNPDTLSKFDKV